MAVVWTAKMSRSWLSLVPSGTAAADATDDWHSSVDGYWPEMKVSSILFRGTAAGERVVVRDGGVNGPEICDLSITGANDQNVKYIDNAKWSDPYIDYSECVMSLTTTASKVMFEFS